MAWPFDMQGFGAPSGFMPSAPGMPGATPGNIIGAAGTGFSGAGNFVSGLPGGQIPGGFLSGVGGGLSDFGHFLGGMFGGGGGGGSYISGPDYSYTGPAPYWYNTTGPPEQAPFLSGIPETAPRGFTGQNSPDYFTPHRPMLQNPGWSPPQEQRLPMLKNPEHPWAAPIWTGGFGTGWLGSHFGTPTPAQGQSAWTTQGTYQAGVTPPPNPMAGK